MPLPASAEERTRLLNRAVRDLFGAAPTAEETAAFLADGGPNALDSLAKRLEHRPGLTTFSGKMTSGPTKFRVLAADPDAAKRPPTATDPGHYLLGANAMLVVTRHPVGDRIVNEALIHFNPPEETMPVAHEIKLPDGYNTWAAAWMRGGTVIWVMQRGNVRSYDFTNQPQVKETTLEDPASFDKVPKPILDALRAEFDVPVAPKPAMERPRPAAETPKPATETPK
ncbi:MAG: hypothetical protein JWN24_1608 [Phycisphaerales bacterium]|nr:hypothetical protein [Phycisphaerales bacterium]